MEKLKKSLFLFMLLVVSLTASGFMVIEAGHFYQGLYTTSQFGSMGYLAAGLNEAFMAIMAGVWLPGRTKAKGHPVNFLFRFLVILLFLTTVGGACFNAIETHLAKIASQTNNQEILDVLRSQVADHAKSIDTFAAQHQPVNSAITVRNQVATKQLLIDTLQKQQSVSGLWIEVVFLVVLRFAVQLANLTCVWLIGWIWRQKSAHPSQRPVAEKLSSRGMTAGLAVGAHTPFDTLTNLINPLAGNSAGQRAETDIKSSQPKQTSVSTGPVTEREALEKTLIEPLEITKLSETEQTSKGAAPQELGVEETPKIVGLEEVVVEPEKAVETATKKVAEPEKSTVASEKTIAPSPRNSRKPAAPVMEQPVEMAVQPKVAVKKKATKKKAPAITQKKATLAPKAPVVKKATLAPKATAVKKARVVKPAAVLTKAPKKARTSNIAKTAMATSPKTLVPARPSTAKAEPINVVASPRPANNTIQFPKMLVPPRPVEDEVLESSAAEVDELRRKVRLLVEKRNPGVTLSSFCAAINQNPEDIREICNLRQPLDETLEERLGDVLSQIEQLQQEEWAVGC